MHMPTQTRVSTCNAIMSHAPAQRPATHPFRHPFRVTAAAHLESLDPPCKVGPLDLDGAIKATRSCECSIQDILPTCRWGKMDSEGYPTVLLTMKAATAAIWRYPHTSSERVSCLSLQSCQPSHQWSCRQTHLDCLCVRSSRLT